MIAVPAVAQVQAPEAPAATAPAAADAGEDAGVADIIVTATRREQGAQSVPLALTAVSGDQLRTAGVNSTADLVKIAPSLFVVSDISAGSPRYSLRGVTAGDVTATSSPAVATYVDDVQQTAQFGIGASLFDLGRVEVLRGPQGTTFGKNTTAGAINYFSQTPTNRAEGYVSGRIGFGDRPERYIEGAVNVPIVTDKLAARISFRTDDKSAWQRDLGPSGKKRGDSNSQALRAQLRWTPDELTVVNLTGYLARGRSDQQLNHTLQLQPPGGPFFPVNYYIAPGQRTKETVEFTNGIGQDDFDNRAVTLRIERDLGNFSLTSISHFRESKQRISQDLDGTPVDLFYYRTASKAQQYGEELRLASDSSLPLSGLIGAFFEHDKITERATETSTTYGVAPGLAFGPFSSFIDFAPRPVYDYNAPGYYTSTTKTYALFGNLTYRFTDQLSVTGGLRKTWEKKRFRGTEFYYISGQRDWELNNVFFDPANPPATPDKTLVFDESLKARPWTWDATVNFNPSRRLLVFGRVARGFRSGGFNQPEGSFPFAPFFVPAPFFFPQTPASYGGETLTSYEVGIKSTPFPGIRVNATVFHYDYEDQQVTTFPNGLLLTTNAGTSKVDGGELEIVANPVGTAFDFRGSLTYTNARYSNFVSPGDPACQTPPPGTPGFCTGFQGDAILTGNKLNQAPKWTANAEVGYTFPFGEEHGVRFSTNATYRSQIFYSQYNIEPESDRKRLFNNARITFARSDGEGLSVSGYVNNLLDVRATSFAFAAPAPDLYNQYFTPGRTFGIDATYRW